MNTKTIGRISSIGWLNCHDGSINLTPCLDGNVFPTIVNVTHESFEKVRNDENLMKQLAAEMLDN